MDRSTAIKLLKRWGDTGHTIRKLEQCKKDDPYHAADWQDKIDEAISFEWTMDEWLNDNVTMEENIMVYYRYVELEDWKHLNKMFPERTPVENRRILLDVYDKICGTWGDYDDADGEE